MSLIYNIHDSWKPFFTEEIMEKLNKIEEEIGDSYFPAKENILRFASTNLDNVKCVIVGMEPYPSSYIKDGKVVPEATGRSFEVSSIKDKDWSYKFKQSSLRNILKTIYYNETQTVKSLDDIRTEISDNKFHILNPGDWFDDLENQGVLFLNATLTVKPGVVDTHTKIWKDFFDELIPFIDNKNVKWLLWGAKAQERVLPHIKSENAVCACHPRIADFVYENPFGKIKDIKWCGEGCV